MFLLSKGEVIRSDFQCVDDIFELGKSSDVQRISECEKVCFNCQHWYIKNPGYGKRMEPACRLYADEGLPFRVCGSFVSREDV